MNRFNYLQVVFAVALTGIMGGCQTTFEVPEYSGAKLYQGYCASCHGSTGKGDGPVAPAMTVLMQDLRTIQNRNGGVFPRAVIEETIDGRGMRASHGTADMPVWGWAFYRAESRTGEAEPEKFAEARITALVDYLEAIQITD